jgi:uncharacterized protein
VNEHPPTSAAWQHRGLRVGFETLFVHRRAEGLFLAGCTTAVEAGTAWAAHYEIGVDERWVSRRAHVVALTGTGTRSRTLVTDGQGSWQVDGRPAPLLEGCLDVDLEASAMTNTLPIHRLAWDVGEKRSVPAAYVRSSSLDVQRLEQSYERLTGDHRSSTFRYEAPAFEFACELVVDSAGFVLDYPGIATRAL